MTLSVFTSFCVVLTNTLTLSHTPAHGDTHEKVGLLLVFFFFFFSTALGAFFSVFLLSETAETNDPLSSFLLGSLKENDFYNMFLFFYVSTDVMSLIKVLFDRLLAACSLSLINQSRNELINQSWIPSLVASL